MHSTRPSRSRTNLRWHAKPDKPHEGVFGCVRKLLDSDKRRRELTLWLDLFLDAETVRRSKRFGSEKVSVRARYNVIRNACETLAARVFKNQPRPWVVTAGGDWKLQRKAKQCTAFVGGDFDRLDAEAMRQAAGLDGLVFGTGAIKVYAENGERVAWQRVWRGNLLVDPREEAANSIRTLYQIAAVDREVLAESYPENKRQISLLPTFDSTLLKAEAATDDLVMVCEAWRLPSAPGLAGRHAICIDGETLCDDDWTRDSFPFAFLHATRNPLRFWGVGYPERMAGLQAEQNYIDEAISDGVRLFSPKFVNYSGNAISGDSYTNDIGDWIDVNGSPQTVQQLLPAPAHAQLMMHALEHRRSLLEIEGISPMSAQSQKPAGIDSGKGLQTLQDVESERFAMLGQANERFTTQLAKLHIETCEEIVAAGNGSKLVALAGKRTFDALKYTDVRLGDNPYQAKVYPISAVASSPAGKLGQLSEMLQMGMIGPEEAREIYDLPDLEALNDNNFAPRENARRLIESALDGEVFAAPRTIDKAYLLKWGWAEFNRAQLQGAKDADLRGLVRLLGQVDGLVKQEAMQAQAAMAMQAAAAGPAQPPQPAQPPPQPGAEMVAA